MYNPSIGNVTAFAARLHARKKAQSFSIVAKLYPALYSRRGGKFANSKKLVLCEKEQYIRCLVRQ